MYIRESSSVNTELESNNSGQVSSQLYPINHAGAYVGDYPGGSHVELDLSIGTPWQRKYKAYIHWAENQVLYTAEHRVRAIEFASLEDTMYLLSTNTQKIEDK